MSRPSLRRSSVSAWRAAVLGLVATACGARSQGDAGAGGAVASASVSSSTSAAVGGAGGMGGTGGAPGVPTCPSLVLDAGPVPVIDEEGRDAWAPSLVAIDGEVPRVAVQALLSGTPLGTIELATLKLGKGSIEIDIGLTPYQESSTWSPFGRARTTTAAAMVWQNDGLRFGAFDLATWSEVASSTIAPNDAAPMDLVGGASLAPDGRSHDGEGFGVLIDRGLDLQHWPFFALVDAAGALLVEPKSLTYPQAPSGRGAITWSGSHYLIAQTDPTGCPGVAGCTGMSLYRFVPGADAPFDSTWSRPDAQVEDVALAPVGDEIWLVFLDQGSGTPLPHLQRFDRDGAPLGDLVVVGSPATSVRLVGIPGGALMALRSYEEVVALHLDAQGEVIGAPITLMTGYVGWGSQAVTAFEGGVAVAGAFNDDGHSIVSVTTLRCQSR